MLNELDIIAGWNIFIIELTGFRPRVISYNVRVSIFCTPHIELAMTLTSFVP